jgi:hypothetical protein
VNITGLVPFFWTNFLFTPLGQCTYIGFEQKGGTHLNSTNYKEVAIFEHRFWLQILGDHARFIFHSLSPNEIEEVKRANQFIQVFDQLLVRSRQALSDRELTILNQQSYQYVHELRSFKLHLVQRHLEENIEIQLSPVFLNHMVNELEEYLRILGFLLSGEIPPVFHPVHHHLLWLLDASGHAVAIIQNTDRVETKIIEKSEMYVKQFEHFYIKAVEVAGFMRSNLKQFPALSRFNYQVELELKCFKEFLRELEELELKNQLLGTLSPLMADHFAREECYYLTKLAQSSDVGFPDCDPTKART